MTGARSQDSNPDVPWGKVVGVAGGVAAAWLTYRGGVGLVRLAYHEVHDRVMGGAWVSRRG